MESQQDSKDNSRVYSHFLVNTALIFGFMVGIPLGSVAHWVHASTVDFASTLDQWTSQVRPIQADK